MPKVSICIPAYENAEGIQKLLRSIEEQTYTDFEVFPIALMWSCPSDIVPLLDL